MSNIRVKKRYTFLGHNDSLYCLESLDDYQFLSAGSDGMVVRWDLRSPDEGEVIIKIQGSIYAMAYDRESGLLYVGENHEGIHQIDLTAKKEIRSVRLDRSQIFDLEVFDGRVWAAMESGELIRLSEKLEVLDSRKFASQRARSIDFYGSELAVGYSDHTTRIINAETFEVSRELKAHKNSVFTSRYHPSGKYLITGGRDASLKVWDTNVDYVLRESIAAHLYTIHHLTFSKDGKYFVTCSMDKSIKLWNAYNFKLLKVIDKHRHAGHGNSVNKLLWMKYEDLLVSCSDDRTISVWEINMEE